MLRTPPSETGFDEVRRKVSDLVYIDLEKLEKAYRQVPVFAEEDIGNCVRVLEAFADYLATSWARVFRLVSEQEQRIRESQLLRKEFAHLLLAGNPTDGPALADLSSRLGFTLAPNRVLVVHLEQEDEFTGRDAPFDLALTAALNSIEALCDTEENMAVAYLRRRGISVFFHDSGSGSADPLSPRVRSLAQRMLDAIRSSSSLRARIGIGGPKKDLKSVAQSWEEASMALAQSADVLAAYRSLAAPVGDLGSAAEKICSLLAARRFSEARTAIDALRPQANLRLGDNLALQRQFFCSTLYSICFCARQLGADREMVDQALWKMDGEIHGANSRLLVQEVYQNFANSILDEVRRLYSGRHDKLVERARRAVDRLIENPETNQHVSSSLVAQELQVSSSHLSRTFKQATGLAFERFVMKRRVDYARQLLLDPAYNVSLAAERCGCYDAAYFARIFRQIAGCTPREYMQNPLRAGTREGLPKQRRQQPLAG